MNNTHPDKKGFGFKLHAFISEVNLEKDKFNWKSSFFSLSLQASKKIREVGYWIFNLVERFGILGLSNLANLTQTLTDITTTLAVMLYTCSGRLYTQQARALVLSSVERGMQEPESRTSVYCTCAFVCYNNSNTFFDYKNNKK